jgi:hypothetical protein
MTGEMLDLARTQAHRGDPPLPDRSVEVVISNYVISNCVIGIAGAPSFAEYRAGRP